MSRLLVILLMLVMAVSMSACKKKGNNETAESNISVTEAVETEAAETETVQSETAESEWSGGITEVDGEVIIEVPEGEDSTGE